MTKPFVEFDLQRHRLLGLLNGAPIFAVETLTEGEVHDLREVGFQLSDNERDIAAAASAIVIWHQLEPMCPDCGGPTTVINGGFARHCAPCGRDHFPRTDPAVIVAVVDGQDRLLLGGQQAWGNRVSVLAGFVEAGESLEQAIHREIGEEVDISLSELVYFGSQPWPFPRSLMIGFFARASSTDICVDADEIAFADWHTRDGLAAKLEAGELGPAGSQLDRVPADPHLAGRQHPAELTAALLRSAALLHSAAARCCGNSSSARSGSCHGAAHDQGPADRDVRGRKSTVLAELARRGHRVVDTDHGGWTAESQTANGRASTGSGARSGRRSSPSRWRSLFVSGTVSNQGRFYPRFDAIVLLTAPLEVLLARVAARKTNDYGKADTERAEIIHYVATVEPLLRAGATAEIDTRAPVSAVADELEMIAR